MSKYAIELVDPTGLLLADLSGRAKDRTFTQSRNQADEISFSIDLREFEAYAALLNIDPKLLIINASTEVRIKRGQSYLSGGQVSYTQTDLEANDEKLGVRAMGFLNLFKKRFAGAERIFTATDGSVVAWTLIDESQTGTNRSFGVTQGVLATTGNHDRTYRRTNLKEALQALSQVQTNPLDFEFTYDKKFNTYKTMGSTRPDVIFEWPGNIRSATVTSDATELTNNVTVLGSGFGELAASQAEVDDLASQANFKVREEVITENETTDDAQLAEYGNVELAAWSFPFEILKLEVDGNVAPFVTDYGIGDYVRIRIRKHPWLSHIDAMYRVEKRTVEIDNEDNEKVTLEVVR